MHLSGLVQTSDEGFLAPVVGWGRYEHFEYGCCIAFSDNSPNVRSYVITALIAVFFLPICKSVHHLDSN